MMCLHGENNYPDALSHVIPTRLVICGRAYIYYKISLHSTLGWCFIVNIL